MISKGNFPLPNIHILIDNCAKYEFQYCVDCFAGYHKILMDEEDVEKQHSSCKSRMVLEHIVYRCEKPLKSRYIYRKSNKYSEENNLKNGEQLLLEWRGSF